MTNLKFQRLTGLFFIIGTVLLNIPYTLLIINFDYPDILRQPTAHILTQFHAGGANLIFTWLAFAWVGLPVLFAVVMLKKIMGHENHLFLETATVIGVIGMIVQVLGLLRWVFVVPVLANLYTDPAASEATQAAVIVAFQLIHQYGGVVLGEHIGQFFSIVWTIMISLMMLKSSLFKPWLGWFGLGSGLVYLTAQTELLATVLPNFPVVPEGGLVGSIVWLLWLITVGIVLLRVSPQTQPDKVVAVTSVSQA